MNEKFGNSKIETRKSPAVGKAPRNAPPVRDFKDLQAWKTARELRREIYRLGRSLPDSEKFGLASQLRRAASSVTANIAEGFGRFGYQENIQLCRQARGSLYELRDHLTTCVDEGYVSLDEGTRLDKLAQRAAQVLNGYLRSTLALKAATDE
jgi:four helix bundle protein